MKALLKASFNLVAVVVAIFALLAVFVAKNTSSLMVSEAERTVRSVVKNTTGQIDQLMLGVETAVANSVWIIREHLDDPDYMYRITRELVVNNEYIVGSAIAFRPGYYVAKGPRYSPYTCIDKAGRISSFSLEKNESGEWYYEQGWYVGAERLGSAIWSEPYFDDGGADIMMSTYSVPLKDDEGKIFAVFTADLSLEQLTAHVASICPYAQSYATMKTREGKYLVEPPPAASVYAGDGKTITICDTASNGWAVEITCPIENILAGAQKMVVRIVIFSILGVGLIFLLSWIYSGRLQRSTALRERMEGELTTARDIQRSITPHEFSERIFGILRPAREVGGDLFDFAESGDKVYFIIGDASGKGVPAALFSFVAGTVFRMSAGMGLGCAEILERINIALTRGNDMCMFVTAFVGLLDRASGRLEYASAGHNPPVIIGADGKAEFLRVKRAPPAGTLETTRYAAAETTLAHGAKIFIYTDGVTEAMRADQSQFGEKRLLECLAAAAAEGVETIVNRTVAAVDEFVAGAEQWDDITVMAIEA